VSARDHADPLSVLLSRRSLSPRKLAEPGLSAQALHCVMEAALRAPDHGRLLPWRVIEIPRQRREELAALFADEKRCRSDAPSELDLTRACEHALQPPTLLAFVTRCRPNLVATEPEQWLSAGSALGYLLLACHAMGYAAIVLSGLRCRDEALQRALGVGQEERLSGFVSIGTAAAEPSPMPPNDLAKVLSTW